MYAAGECVIIETNFYRDGRRKAHLFVVLLEVGAPEEMTILVPMDKIPERGYYDPTTVLAVGEHDFVKEPTFMNYSEAIRRSQKWIDQNARRRPPPVDAALLGRICAGIQISEDVVYDVYDEWLFRKR